MSKTYCRFCELTFNGLYINCPKCGKYLPPFKGKDIAPDDEYEIVDDIQPTPTKEEKDNE